MSPNVPVVYDGFVFAMLEMRSISRKHKTVVEWGVGAKGDLAEQNPSRFSGDAYTILLCAGFALLILFFIFLSKLILHFHI